MKKSITIYDEVIDYPLWSTIIEKADNFLHNRCETHGWTNYSWQEGIIKDSAPVLIYDLKKEAPEISKEIKKSIAEKCQFDIKESSIMLYLWTSGSHIPWHEDAHADFGMTLYLNDHWDRDWGGAFMYEIPDDSGDIGAIYPKPRSAILQQGGVPHHVCPTTRDSPIRLTIQLFGNI